MKSTLNYTSWIEQGDGYLKAGTPKSGKSKFGNEILYNVLSMAFECYAMAILDFHKSLPDNHTYTDLINGLDKVMQWDNDLRQKLLKFESIQSICAIDKFAIASPDTKQIEELRESINLFRQIAYNVVYIAS